MPIRSGNEAIAGGDPPPITGNLTATLPVAVSAIRQVIGGVADISINTFAGGAPGAVPNSMGGVINYLREDGTWAVPAGAAHDLLSITHPDTLPDAVVKGDVVVGNATPKWSRLPANATGIKKYLQSYSGGVPSWEQVDYDDLSGSDPHNSLPGLQGGSYPSEYYHLSQAEWSGIQTLSGGLSGQVPYKLSDASWDIGWTTLSGGGGSLTVETVDGLLSIPNVTKIKVSNGTLINNGGGTVTIATGDGMIPGIPYTSSFSVTVAIGDALEFRGSANKVMRLYELYFAKPNVNVVVTGIKRSTADTGGTSSNATVVPHDSTDPSASCILKLYTVAPSAGVAVGTIFREAVSGALDRVSNRFDVGKGITLRGATESFAVTVDVACLLHGWARWTEE